MSYRCPDSRVIDTGMLYGWKLVFKYHADIIEDKDCSVPVLIWDVSEDDIEALDMYEGYPRYYITKQVDVKLDNGKTVNAFVYVMKDKYDVLEAPSYSYFKTIENGYIENEMDISYLYNAIEEAGAW